MDIRAISLLNGASSSAAALTLPVDARAVIGEIAGNEALSDGEKGGLIAAVATVDQGLSGNARSVGLAQIQGLGVYLRNTGNDGFPRWSMMTALRAYGLNLATTSAVPVQPQPVVQAAVQSQLNDIAQSSRGVSLNTALAVAQATPAPVVKAAAKAAPATSSVPHVEKVV